MPFQSENKSVPKSQRGQGLVEYLIIVALMAVATMGIMRVMGQSVSAKFAEVTFALQGKHKSVSTEQVKETLYKKKDMSTFFNGAGDGKGSSNSLSPFSTDDDGI